MAFLTIEHSFNFTAENRRNYEEQQFKSQVKSFSGKGEIPQSKWQLACEKVPYSDNQFRAVGSRNSALLLMVNLENYENFKNGNYVAFGTFHVKGDSEGFSRYHCDLQQIQLNNLTGKTVWNRNSADNGRNMEWENGMVYTVTIKITIIFIVKQTVPDPARPASTSNNKLKMQDDFASLFENQLYSDLVLVAEGKEFKVHKNILCARSVVFQAMFEADMKEKHENKVVIRDIKSGVMQNLLKYMYTGTCENFKKKPGLLEDLYIASDKYAMPDLKADVAQRMCNDISAANIGRRLILADQFKEKLLRQKCFDFIGDNRASLANQEDSLFF